MEKYKSLEEITLMDERHGLMDAVRGGETSLEAIHSYVATIELDSSVPEFVKSQFDIARNMSLYTYFCYSLAPEVHMKSYSVMELAIREYFGKDEKTNLKTLVKRAVDLGIITDKGFRHVADDSNNKYSKVFADSFPKLRNNSAHGTTMLVPDCIGHLEKCADFINQLFLCKSKKT